MVIKRNAFCNKSRSTWSLFTQLTSVYYIFLADPDNYNVIVGRLISEQSHGVLLKYNYTPALLKSQLRSEELINFL